MNPTYFSCKVNLAILIFRLSIHAKSPVKPARELKNI
jgi:hypothetical protein